MPHSPAAYLPILQWLLAHLQEAPALVAAFEALASAESLAERWTQLKAIGDQIVADLETFPLPDVANSSGWAKRASLEDARAWLLGHPALQANGAVISAILQYLPQIVALIQTLITTFKPQASSGSGSKASGSNALAELFPMIKRDAANGYQGGRPRASLGKRGLGGALKLGCLPPRPGQQARLLQARKYLHASLLPSPPVATNWRQAVALWGMLDNDTVGDCTEAAVGHALLAWSANSNATVVLPNGQTLTSPDSQLAPYVLAAYERVSGYNPADTQPDGSNPTDSGAVIADVLADWQANGVAGNKLGAFVSCDPTDHTMVATVIDLFGGGVCGVNLPAAWQNAVAWTAPSRFHRFGAWKPGSWGGHCVLAIDYDSQYVYVVSWGAVVPVTWAAFDMYFSEFHGLLDNLWVTGQKAAPNGFDLATLQSDMQAGFYRDAA